MIDDDSHYYPEYDLYLLVLRHQGTIKIVILKTPDDLSKNLEVILDVSLTDLIGQYSYWETIQIMGRKSSPLLLISYRTTDDNSISKIVTYDIYSKTLGKTLKVPYGPRDSSHFHPCKHSNGFYLLSAYQGPSASHLTDIITGYVDLTTNELILAPEGVFSYSGYTSYDMTDVDILVRTVQNHGCLLYYFDVKARAWSVQFVPLPDFGYVRKVLLQKLLPDGHVQMSICYRMSNSKDASLHLVDYVINKDHLLPPHPNIDALLSTSSVAKVRRDAKIKLLWQDSLPSSCIPHYFPLLDLLAYDTSMASDKMDSCLTESDAWTFEKKQDCSCGPPSFRILSPLVVMSKDQSHLRSLWSLSFAHSLHLPACESAHHFLPRRRRSSRDVTSPLLRLQADQTTFFKMFGVDIQTAWRIILQILYERDHWPTRLPVLFGDLSSYLSAEQKTKMADISQSRKLLPFTGFHVMRAIWHDDELMRRWLADAMLY